MCETEKNKVKEEEKTTATAEDSTNQSVADNATDKPATEQENESENPLLALQNELAETKDKYLRMLADFENYKKRTLKEKTELILNGGEKTVIAILPVLDDMERAIDNADKADSKETLEEGWELICSKLKKILEGLGLKRIDTENANFDVDFHEAIALVPGLGDDKKGKVIDCTQAGYMLNDKVIRHAKVAVGN